MEESYWDRLDKIRRTAEMLQRSPIPETELGCNNLLSELEIAEDHMRQMLRIISPYVEVWCGEKGEAGQGNRPHFSDWDSLLK